MAPPPIKVTINSKVYNIPILNEDMSNLVQQMESIKNEIRRSTERRQNAVTELENCCNALLLQYITLTGNFPE
jgi:hypothetical protein